MKRLAPDADDARFIRRVLIVILIVALTAAVWRAGNLLILAFGSMLGAVAIRAIAEIYGRVVPQRATMPLAVTTVLAVIGFLGWLFGVEFAQQINQLVSQLPHLLDQLSHWMSQSPVGAKIVEAVKAAFAGSRVASDIGGLLSGSGQLLLNCILLLVGALFFSADPDVYQRGALLLVPPSVRPVFADALVDVGTTLRLWLRAELIGMTSMGLLVGTGLWIAGVPSAWALGLLAGLSEFIPYVGPTAAMLPALGLAATAGTAPLMGTLITYAIVRVIQTNFVTPYVQSRVIDIPPAITVFAIIAIGFVFGLFGLFFSAGLLVVGFSLVRSLYLREVLGEDLTDDAESPRESRIQAD